MAPPKHQPRRKVERIDAQGRVTAIYNNEADAAKANFVSKATVSLRCNGKTKHPFRGMDFSFQFAETPQKGQKRPL